MLVGLLVHAAAEKAPYFNRGVYLGTKVILSLKFKYIYMPDKTKNPEIREMGFEKS